MLKIDYKLKIKQIRLKQKLTQEELAQKLDIPQQEVSRLENEKNALTVKNLIRIAIALNVSLDDLVEYEKEKVRD